MTLPILKTGSRGPLVSDLQAALNTTLRPNPGLAQDGRFGPKTDAAVKRFQRDNWLVADGDVGPCTHNCLYGHEAYTPVLHNVPFIPQPTQTTCWAASTAMMTRSSVMAVKARTPQEMWSDDAGLFNRSDTDDAVTSGNRFARIHGLRCFPPRSWTLSAMQQQLRQGPLMFDMLWNARDYAGGAGSAGHMIVVTGIRGDNDQSGAGTTLRIQDPWPPGRGRRHSVGYKRWMAEVPTRTYRVFAR